MRLGAVAALVAVAVLGGAASAHASTKWLCGPGVANDPCRPEPEHDGLPRLGRAHGHRDAEARPRPRRRLLLRLPDRLRPADPPGDQARRSRAALDRALPGRALLPTVPRLRPRLPAGDRAGAAGGDDDAPRLPDRLRRRRGGLRRIPAPHRPAARVRADRTLAGDLSPAAPDTAAHRRPSRAAPPAGVRGPARRERDRPQGLGPRRRVPPRPDVPARRPALLRDRVQHVQRDAAGDGLLRPRVEPRRGLPEPARRAATSRPPAPTRRRSAATAPCR